MLLSPNNVNAPRINAIINTDKPVYEPEDQVFVEILLIDPLKKTPYQFSQLQSVNTNAAPQNAQLQLQSTEILIVLTDLNGISIGKTSQEINYFNFTRILTNPSLGFTYLLPKNLSDGQYLISVVSKDFPPEQKVIQVKSYYDFFPQKYEVKLMIFNEKVELNQTIYGRVDILNNTQIYDNFVPLPSNYSSYTLSINYKCQSIQETLNLTLDQSEFIYFSINPQIYLEQGKICQLQIKATIKIDNSTYQSDELGFKLGDIDYSYYQNIKAIFQSMQLSDPVVNDYQTIYYYTYVDQNQTGQVTDIPFIFKNGRFGAYVNDGKRPDASMPTSTPFNFQGSAMIGNHFTITADSFYDSYYPYPDIKQSQRNVIRIPIIIDGIQTIRKQYQNQLDLSTVNYTFDPQQLKTFKYSKYDNEFGLYFNYSDGIFSLNPQSISQPLLVLGSFPTLDKLNQYFSQQYQLFSAITSKSNDFTTNAQVFNTQQKNNLNQNNLRIVQKFVNYTIEFLGYIYQNNVTALRFTNDSQKNLNILVSLFPEYSNAKLISYYGLQNIVQSICKNSIYQGEIANKSLNIGVTFSIRDGERVFGADDNLIIYINTSYVPKNSGIYLLSIKNKEKFPNGGILTLNLHRIKQEYFNFDTAIGSAKYPICDYNIIQTMIKNGTLPRSILDNRDNSQCIHISLNGLVNFTEFIGAISFFKTAQTNTTRAEIKQMRDNYVPEDKPNENILEPSLSYQAYFKNEIDENTLGFLNPQNITLQPFALFAQYFGFTLANKNTSYQYSVQTYKMSKQSKHILSFVVTRNQSFEQYAVSIEQSTKILPIGTRKFINSAGIIQLNQSLIQDAIQFTVLMADVYQYNTTFVEVVILPSYEAYLKQTLTNLAKKKIETADDIFVQLELINQLIDVLNNQALNSNNIATNLGVITESISKAKYLCNQMIYYEEWTVQNARDKNGNYNLGSSNLANSAPQNISNAFILYSIKEVEQTYSNKTLNISSELQTLIKAVNKTCNISVKFEDLKSDPIQLALTYLAAFNYSDIKVVQLQNLTDLIFKQLLKHQKDSGEFDSPASQSQFQYSIFNGQGDSRIIEATALGVIAMVQTNKSLYQQNITSAINYLLKQSNQGMFGGNLGTILTFRALKLYGYNHSSLGSDVQFILQGLGIKNKTAKFKSYSEPIQFSLNGQDFNPALKVVPITVSMIGSGLLKKDLGLAFYTVYSNIDNKYEGFNQTTIYQPSKKDPQLPIRYICKTLTKSRVKAQSKQHSLILFA
ncbi:UNKNOWN [Stylonychia lemnae]|uniref:Alpha-2-macroglobulin domain-containing protein n=1 Tax=Stylonychia lemnae TaxID=5949 RepID=A0A078AW97_STYLE|nr:UNKNOWN [Stylonychia lemnae]|eukprot:CDW85507.1 UNKNOWN [Stylonychia lemnae]